MNPVLTGVQNAPLPPFYSRRSHAQSPLLHRRNRPCLLLLSPSSLSISNTIARLLPIAASSATVPPSTSDIEMVRGSDGSWSARPHNVVVLWDLDNKPPSGEPYSAAVALRRVAELFGRVVEFYAYADRQTLLHVPQWVASKRSERKQLDAMERKGLVVPNEPYVCGVCGRKYGTNLELKKHFLQLHERERQKKLARMRSLKGKKRLAYKEKHITGNKKYIEAARDILTPKEGYGLASELRRAGVSVKTVKDKLQAAYSAVKHHMKRSMSRGIDCLILVSDDSDFSEMIISAKDADLRTVVLGDGQKFLGRLPDFWIPWRRVENGEVGEEVLMSGRNSHFQDGEEEDDGEEGLSFFEEEEEEDKDDDDDFGVLDLLFEDFADGISV